MLAWLGGKQGNIDSILSLPRSRVFKHDLSAHSFGGALFGISLFKKKKSICRYLHWIVFPRAAVPCGLGETGVLGLAAPCDKDSCELREDKEEVAGHRGRRGKLISATAPVGKQDPPASGFNEKGPDGNLKSGSASNPQSSGSLE